MQKVRKRAMNSYLENRPRGSSVGRHENVVRDAKSAPRSRLHSESSTGSGSRITEIADQQDEEVMSREEALKIFRGESRRKPSSPVRSTSSHPEEHQVTSSELAVQHPTALMNTQMLFIPDSINFPPPIVQPMRQNVPLPYNSYQVGPLQSIGTPLDPFQTMPQVSHPRVSVESLKFYCELHFLIKNPFQY